MLRGPFASARLCRPVLLALALLLAVPTPPAAAQSAVKSNRKWIYSAIGALVIGVPAYSFTSGNGFNTSCSSRSCVGIVTGLMGAVVGFLIGSEFDSSYKRRMAAGPTIDYGFRDLPLGIVPDRMSAFSGGAAVVGLGGARLVFADGIVLERATGVRGIQDVAVMPALDLLVLSTYSNLIGFPVREDTAQGQVIDERGGGSMELFEEKLAVAGFDSLTLLRLQRSGGDVRVETLAGLENYEFITDMAFSRFGRVGWVLMEDRLVAYSSALEKIGEARLPAAGRTVRAQGRRLVVAAGTNGVFVLDAADPAAPEVVQHYTGVRFAYAADLDEGRMYVAAGPEGVAVVDISGAEPQVIGVARRPRYATDVVAAGDGEVWILDREGRRVQIAEFGGAGTGGDSSR